MPEKRAFQRSLLRWYKTHRRDLPWRRDHDPYRILVSEFMLQQTRAETVIPYFHRFLEVFPALESLALAPLERVLRVWSGLGYYARARNLHAAAGIVWRNLGGKIPSSPQALLELPGVGSYTAGAVASIAFGRAVPAVDGNAKRVIGRIFSRNSFDSDLEKLWEAWIPLRRASDFNQAVMDLGAGICGPVQPRCLKCPVRRTCRSQGALPAKKGVARNAREEEWAVALVEKEGRFLIHRNERRGLLGALWQFPVMVSRRGRKPDEKKLLRKFLRREFGIDVKIRGPVPELVYAFTHITATVRPFLCVVARISNGGISPEPVRWIKLRGLSRYPVSTLMRKIAALLPSGSYEPGRGPEVPPVDSTIGKAGRAARPSGSGRSG